MIPEFLRSLLEVTSDLQNANYHLCQEKYAGHSLTKGEAASLAERIYFWH